MVFSRIGISPTVSFVGCESGLGCVAKMCAQQAFMGFRLKDVAMKPELAFTRNTFRI